VRWQNGSGPTDRSASSTEKTWTGLKISTRQLITAQSVKSAGLSGQPTSQNGSARGPYKLMNKKKHVQCNSRDGWSV